MKNKIVFIITFAVSMLFFYSPVWANTNIHLNIKTNTGSIYNQDITVAPCDSEGTGTMEITAYCALSQSGITSDWSGLWTNSINGIVNNANNNGVYWMWLVNLNTNDPYSDFACHQDAPYGCSAKQYILNPNDNVLFYYNIDPLAPTTTTQITGGGPLLTPSIAPIPIVTSTLKTEVIKPVFDLKKALNFLVSQQKGNGSFGESLYTDWITLALTPTPDYQEQKIKLIKYFSENKLSSESLTDSERHAMALMALNLNPYDTNKENYIQKIIDSFDGKQFGDINEDNDDIFALIVLQNAGYSTKDKIISDDLSFILSKQKTDGSWDASVDLTGAGMEALAIFNKTDQIKDSLIMAKDFLKRNQKKDGGWNNISTTAWAMEGILGLNEKIEDWKNNGNDPLDYLSLNQDADGGITEKNLNNKIWETAYATSVISGKTWNQIMQKFETPSLASDGVKTLLTISTPSSTINKIAKNKAKQDTIEIVKTQKNNLNRITSKNTANIIDATKNINQTKSLENSKKQNWFMQFLGKIFKF